jgi:hypothetical protein
MSRLRQCSARRGLRRSVSRAGIWLSILLVALLLVAAQSSAEELSEALPHSMDEVHGAASDETRAARDVDQSEAPPIARSGSSAPEHRAKPADPAQRRLLPFIILKSFERPFMISPK